jgi:drug/metabolite transporter (DMT)-like permease
VGADDSRLRRDRRRDLVRARPGGRLSADLVLFLTNLVYGTSYAAARLTLDAVPPATLAFVRCVLATALLGALMRRQPFATPLTRGDHARLAAMGAIGFGGAFALSHWGLVRSTASNGALLMVVEPITIMVCAPLMLGEALRRREAVGAVLALLGTVVVVLNGVPGLTPVVPHWRGDVLLIVSGVAYAAYSLIGRDVLRRHPSLPVTASSVMWGAVSLAPLAMLEWGSGLRPTLGPWVLAGVLYLGFVITGLMYFTWNWSLERVPAPRAAVFLNVQPIAGALLGVLALGEALTPFTVIGGAMTVGGLWLTAKTG